MSEQLQKYIQVDENSGGYGATIPIATLVGNAGCGPEVEVCYRYSAAEGTWGPGVSWAHYIYRFDGTIESLTYGAVWLYLSTGERISLNYGESVVLPNYRIISKNDEIWVFSKDGRTEVLGRIGFVGVGGSGYMKVVYCAAKKITTVEGRSVSINWAGDSAAGWIIKSIEDDGKCLLFEQEVAEEAIKCKIYTGKDVSRSVVMKTTALDTLDTLYPYAANRLRKFKFTGVVYDATEVEDASTKKKTYNGRKVTIKSAYPLRSLSISADTHTESVEAIADGSKSKVSKYSCSFAGDLIANQVTSYSYGSMPLLPNYKTITAEFVAGDKESTTVKCFNLEGRVFKETITEGGEVTEIVQDVIPVKEWDCFLGYTKISKPNAPANEQNTTCWIMDLEGNITYKSNNGIAMQWTYYKTRALSVEAKNQIKITDQSLFAWMTYLMPPLHYTNWMTERTSQDKKGVWHGTRVDRVVATTPYPAPSASKRFNLPSAANLSCPLDPNYHNSHLESERVYKWVGGKVVDLSLTFYGYTKLKLKGPKYNVADVDWAIKPSQKLVVYNADCGQDDYSELAKKITHAEILEATGVDGKKLLEQLSAAQKAAGFKEEIVKQTIEGFLPAFKQTLEAKLKSYKANSMTLEETRYVNDINDPFHDQVKSTMSAILDNEGKVVADSAQHLNFSNKVVGDNVERSTSYPGKDASTSANSKICTSIYTGQLISSAGPDGYTAYAYDAQRRLISVAYKATDKSEEKTTTYEYPTAGDSFYYITPAEGRRMAIGVDALGREVNTFIMGGKGEWLKSSDSEYAKDGRLAKSTSKDYSFDDKPISTVIVSYSSEGDTQIVEYAMQNYDGVPVKERKHYRYDKDTRQLQEWTEIKRSSSTTNPPVDETLKYAKTITQYNLDGAVASVQLQGSDGTVLHTNTYSYDAWGRVSTASSTGQPEISYQYDDFGRVTQTTCDGVNTITERPAHVLADIVSKTKIQKVGESNVYEVGRLSLDRLGRIISTNIGGREVKYRYQKGDRWGVGAFTTPTELGTRLSDFGSWSFNEKFNLGVIETTQSGEEHSWSSKVKHTLGGLVHEETDAAGGETRYSYSGGRCTQSLRLADNKAFGARTHYYHRGDVLVGEEVTRSSTDTCLSTTFAHDKMGREIERTFTCAGFPTISLTREYDEGGRVTASELKQNNSSLRKESFSYTTKGQLLKYTCSGQERPVTPWGALLKQQDFTYDTLGNMLTCVSNTDAGSNTSTYTYDTNDKTRLLSVANSDENIDDIKLEYDSEGRLNSRNGHSYDYDVAGRVNSIAHEGGKDCFVYATDGRLLGKKDQRTIKYEYCGERITGRVYLTGDANTQRTTRLLTLGTGAVLQSTQVGNADAAFSFELCDANGSLIATLDHASKSPTFFSYTPFGYRASADDDDHWLGFNGEVLDTGNQVYHLGHSYRVYDPELQQFTKSDSESPFGIGGTNPYSYCSNDPVNRHDPSGHVTVTHQSSSYTHMPLTYNPVFRTALFAGIGVALAPFTGGASIGWTLAVVGLAAVSAAFDIASAATAESDPELSAWLGRAGMASGILSGAVAMTGAKVAALSSKKWISVVMGEKATLEASGSKVQNYIHRFSDDLHYLEDIHKGGKRLTIQAHGVMRPGDTSATMKVGDDYWGAYSLISNVKHHGIDLQKYKSIRLLVCNSANAELGFPSLAEQIHKMTGKPVKGFLGTVRANFEMNEVVAALKAAGSREGKDAYILKIKTEGMGVVKFSEFEGSKSRYFGYRPVKFPEQASASAVERASWVPAAPVERVEVTIDEAVDFGGGLLT